MKQKAKEAIAAAAAAEEKEEAASASEEEAKETVKDQADLPPETKAEPPVEATSPVEATAKEGKPEESKESPEYSTPELTADASKHKAGLDDPEVPSFQNPLHHNNPEMKKTYAEDFDSKEAFEAGTVPLPPLDTDNDKVPE